MANTADLFYSARIFGAADALHIDNLAEWLQDEDGLMLVQQLVKQGSLGFANE